MVNLPAKRNRFVCGIGSESTQSHIFGEGDIVSVKAAKNIPF